MVWLLFLDGVTLFQRNAILARKRRHPMEPILSCESNILSTKDLGFLCQIYHHFKCLLCKKPYDKNVVTPEKIVRVWLPLTQIFFCLPKLLTEMPED